MRRFLSLCLAIWTLLTPIVASQEVTPVSNDAVMLAEPSDPYYALAEEIAQGEALPILHSLDEVLAENPAFLLWVVSPQRLSDQVLIAFGQAMHHRQQAISTGIISGSTLDKARDLWQRASQVQGQRAFAVNNANPTAGIYEGRIIAFDGNARSIQPLTRAGLRHVLQNADYVTFTGHGGEKWWQLGEGSDFRASDILSLPPLVIGTASCNTFRIWRAGSIALSFTDKGAAAYAGFVYSPNEGYLIGAYEDLPFRYTWPDFPIGHVVQVQNHGTRQGCVLFSADDEPLSVLQAAERRRFCHLGQRRRDVSQPGHARCLARRPRGSHSAAQCGAHLDRRLRLCRQSDGVDAAALYRRAQYGF
jgi:hypothetical protein